MKNSRNEKPSCFGILDEVFPLGDSGIREVRERCIDCPLRVECLKSALETEEGLRMREELLRRAPRGGIVDWVKRWSDKKMLYNKRLQKEEKGDLALLWKEFKQVLFSPAHFFSETVQTSIKDAFVFGIITGSIGSMFSLFWKLFLLEEKFPSVISALKNADYFGSINTIIFFSFLIIPIIVALGIFTYSILLHIFLVLFGAGKKGLEYTLFVVCYSQAPEVFCLFPMLGSIVASVWRIYIQILGLKYVHETSYTRVILSFIVPAGIFLFILVTVATMLYHMILGVTC